MQLQNLIKEIKKSSELWHANFQNDGSDEDFDARLLIAEYILSKGYDVNVGDHKASRLIQIFTEKEVGQNEEAYCGSEEDMLSNFIQMFAHPDKTLGYLLDDDPIKGVYEPIKNVDEDIYMVINYYESQFWPDNITFQYNFEDFSINV